jgi:DNA invertase Pin-like site-specific DNA recombinase
MIDQKYDPKLPYPFVAYARMSSDAQNPRSPDQQFATIKSTLERLGYPWVEIETYRDDAISGKFVWRRPGFAEMIERIKRGSLKVDLIVVDTFERLGRSEELADIRRQLAVRYGVLVVSGDSGFADPTTAMGRVMAAFESARATEANRIKSHDVIRGKIDAIRQHHWPGGPIPFGFRLKSVFAERHGRQVLDYSVLIPDPKCDWILKALFAQAAETGWGAGRLTAALNKDPKFPDEFKPFISSTVGRWLRNPIFTGTFVWNQQSGDIVEDARVLQSNPESEFIVESGFCESLIDAETSSRVQRLRLARSERALRSRKNADQAGDKLIKPLVPGIALTYPLSGLVTCGECGRAMTVSSCGGYTTKSGDVRRYQAYFCPGSLSGVCSNVARISEEWLRREVVGSLNKRLLLGTDGGSIPDCVEAVLTCDWFAELRTRVQQEVDRRTEAKSRTRPNLESEEEEIRRQICGWQQSLGNPDLEPHVRQCLEAELGRAIQRQAALRDQLDGERQTAQSVRTIVDPQAILDRLHRIDKVLQSSNPSELNVELGYLIDRIKCSKDGTVLLRICRFGLAPELAPLLREERSTGAQALPRLSDDGSRQRRRLGTPRRRSIRRVDDRDAARFVANPDRFAGIPDEWFWAEKFEQPKRQSWAESHADDVYAARFATDGRVQMTYEQLEKLFGRTKPTLRAAVAIAEQRRRQGGAGGDAA